MEHILTWLNPEKKIFEVGQLHIPQMALKQGAYLYIYSIFAQTSIWSCEVAQLQIFFDILKILQILSNIHFQACEAIKTHGDTLL